VRFEEVGEELGGVQVSEVGGNLFPPLQYVKEVIPSHLKSNPVGVRIQCRCHPGAKVGPFTRP